MLTTGSSLAAYKSTIEEHSVSNSNTLDIKFSTEPTSVLEKNEAYGTLAEVPAKAFDYVENCLEDSHRLSISPNPAYGEVSSRAEDDQDYCIPKEVGGATGVVTEVAENSLRHDSSQELSKASDSIVPTSKNLAYGEVSTRAEDDIYYFPEEMGDAAESRVTKNKAYAANTTSRKDRPLSNHPSGLSLQNPLYEEITPRAESD